MLTLNKKELAVLDQTQPEYLVTLIEADRGGSRWWLMQVACPMPNKVFLVVTAHNETKFWKRLDIAIDFIKESCPHTQHVVIRFTETTLT